MFIVVTIYFYGGFMSGDKIMRARCEPELVQRINVYKNREELKNDSAAIRKLLTFALDILDRSVDSPPISNRQLLEEIFAVTRENGAMVCQAHTFVYPVQGVSRHMIDNSKKERAEAKLFGRDKAEKFLAGQGLL